MAKLYPTVQLRLERKLFAIEGANDESRIIVSEEVQLFELAL